MKREGQPGFDTAQVDFSSLRAMEKSQKKRVVRPNQIGMRYVQRRFMLRPQTPQGRRS